MYKNYRLKNYRYGFTLVELLVVIAIVGLLSTVAIFAINPARQSARDTKRIADLKQIRFALDLYFDDNGFYPPSPCGYDCNGWFVSSDSSWNDLQTALAQYINPLPKDPTNTCGPWTTGCYAYAYGNVGRYTYPSTFDLSAQLENPNNPQRCGINGYQFGSAAGAPQYWCWNYGGSYTNQMYEDSPP